MGNVFHQLACLEFLDSVAALVSPVTSVVFIYLEVGTKISRNARACLHQSLISGHSAHLEQGLGIAVLVVQGFVSAALHAPKVSLVRSIITQVFYKLG